MNTRLLVRLSLLVTLALALSYLETLIPLPFPVPGAKLGLTNIVTLYMLGKYHYRDIILVILSRVLLAGFLFGSMSSIIYSLSGALGSFLFMLILEQTKFHLILISIVGGITHNLSQLTVACLVTEQFSLFQAYGPYLILAGFLTGIFNGLITQLINRHLKGSY